MGEDSAQLPGPDGLFAFTVRVRVRRFKKGQMSYSAPDIPAFKAQFNRDFPYSSDMEVGVTDQDIANAYGAVNVNINQGLADTQQTYTQHYLYLAAHYLVLNLRASSQGIQGQYNWIQNSKSVQGVSEGFSIPQRMLDNPAFAQLTKTNYGARYFEMIYPLLAGGLFIARGRTLP